MPKLKTIKSVAKRFTFSKPKRGKGKRPKMLKRMSGQEHFNARETGTVTMRKRRDKEMAKSYQKTIRVLTGR